MAEKYYSIAIDGPSGSGKSSLAKNLSRKLKFVYVDTGALYRTVGLFAKNNNIPLDGNGKIKNYLNNDNIKIDLKYSDGTQCVFLNGIDVSAAIRENIISRYASDVSKLTAVRQFLLGTQQTIADEGNIIMDGRDIGTVILPNADVKIFLTASIEERAKRRYEELKLKGEDVEYEKIRSDIKFRDEQDSTRDIAPLKPAPDAILLDNSSFSNPEETLEYVLNIIKEKIPDVRIW